MQLEHEFEVPVPIDQAWDVLLDVERIAPCMPGATVDGFDGETVEGRVKVKVGPIQVTYAGTARFTEKDEAARRIVIDASGKEARGSGTARASIVGQLVEQGSATRVTVTTDLAITGKPAQFGRGVMVEVGNKLLGKFADCLADEIRQGHLGTAAAPTPTPTEAAPAAPEAETAAQVAAATTGGPAQARAGPATPPLRRVPDNEPLDLLDTAGLPVLKRVAPLLAALVLLVIVWRLLSRSRH